MALTWQEKYDTKREPEIKPLGKSFSGFQAGQRMLIPTPKLIDAWVRSIPAGTLRSVADLKDSLAEAHGAELTCPLCTGMFLRIVSELASESLRAGAPIDSVTPFWRVVDPASPLAKKLTCGPEELVRLRKLEGLA